MSNNIEKAEKHKDFPIHIDRKMYEVDKVQMTGAELRRMAGIADDRDLWQVVPGPQDDILVEEAAVIHLKPGMQFHSIKKIVTPGVILI